MKRSEIKKVLATLRTGDIKKAMHILTLGMDTTIGPEGLDKTWQKEFPSTVTCAYCGATARHAFTAHEGIKDKVNIEETVSAQHPNTISEPDGAFWPHDVVAVAVYFCTTGLCEPTARYNQG